jgi:hypothetical protein
MTESLAHAHLFILDQLSPRALPSLHSASHRLLGAAYHRQGKYRDAFGEHERAYRYAAAGGDPWNMAESRSWQAYGQKALGRHAESLQALEGALHLVANREEPEHARLRARLLASAAQDAARLQDEATAGSYLYASEALLEQLPPSAEFDRAAWLESSGMCALFLGQEALAIRRLDLALREEAPMPHQIIRRTALAEAFARRRDREAALTAAAGVAPQLRVIQSRELNGYFLGFIRRDLPAAFPHDPQCRAFAAEAERMITIG